MNARTLVLLATGALALTPVGAAAQEYATARDVEGKAFVQAYDEGEPQALTRNTPLTDGDSLWTSAGGRVGLLLKDGNRIWLDESSRVEAEQFPGGEVSEERTLQMRLWKGATLLEVASWGGRSAPYTLITPSAVITIGEEGLFFAQIDTVDRTRVVSLRGRCSVTSGGQTVQLDSQQATYAEYGYAPLEAAAADLSDAPPIVEYRNLCMRSHKPASPGGRSQEYLAPDLYAYAPDLDQNGSWNYIDGYGDCWVPEGVDADWTPYSNGHWSYTGWGLTWVPYEPWGWVPFHYGSWCFSAGFGWAWNPGYAFAPAWCSWYWGPDYFGWCPLDMWGYPLWNHCGWYSVNINNIYANNGPVVRHRSAPPPNPIYPRPNPSPGRVTTRSGEPRVQGPSRGPSVTPRDVRDYKSGRLTAEQLKAKSLRAPQRAPGSSVSPRAASSASAREARAPSTLNRGQTTRKDGTTPWRPRGSDDAVRGSTRGSQPGGEPSRVNPRSARTQEDATARERTPRQPRDAYVQDPNRTSRSSPRSDPGYRTPDGGSYGQGESSRRYRSREARPPSGRYPSDSGYGPPRSGGSRDSRAIPSRPSPPVGSSPSRDPGGVRSGGSGHSSAGRSSSASPAPRSSPSPSSGSSGKSSSGSSSSGSRSGGSGSGRRSR